MVYKDRCITIERRYDPVTETASVSNTADRSMFELNSNFAKAKVLSTKKLRKRWLWYGRVNEIKLTHFDIKLCETTFPESQ